MSRGGPEPSLSSFLAPARPDERRGGRETADSRTDHDGRLALIEESLDCHVVRPVSWDYRDNRGRRVKESG
jgi:hypothetical protein